MARAKKTKTKISVLNWMGTLLLLSIPGVNLISIICFLIFAKSPSKRSFIVALILWALIAVILAVAVLLAFPEELGQAADLLRAVATTAVAPVETISIP